MAPVELLCPIFGGWHWLARHAAQCWILPCFVAICRGGLWCLLCSLVGVCRLDWLYALAH